MSTVAQDVQQIREAIYGREVREAIADGIEHCYSDVSGGVTTANTAAAVANAAAQRANTAAAGAEGIPGTASLEDVINLKSAVSSRLKDDVDYTVLSNATKKGITFTINKQERNIKATGTSTGVIGFDTTPSFTGVSRVMFGGTPSSGSSSTYCVVLYKLGGGIVARNIGEDLTVVEVDPTESYYGAIYVGSGVTFPSGGIVFEPVFYINGALMQTIVDAKNAVSTIPVLFDENKNLIESKTLLSEETAKTNGVLSSALTDASVIVGIRSVIGKKNPNTLTVEYKPISTTSAETWGYDVSVRSLLGYNSTSDYLASNYGSDIPYVPDKKPIYIIFEWERHFDYGEQDILFYYISYDGDIHNFTVPLYKTGDGLKGRTIINLRSIIENDNHDMQYYFGGKLFWTSTEAANDAIKTGYTDPFRCYMSIKWLGIFTESEYLYGIYAYDRMSRDSDFVSRAAGVYKSALPSYWIDFPSNITSYNDDDAINKKCKSIPADGVKFIFITDTHWNSDRSDGGSAKNSPNICGYVSSRYNIDRCIHGGDVVDIETTRFKALGMMKNCFHRFREVFGKKFMPTLGNHDQNTPNMQSQSDEYIAEHLIPYTEISKVHITDIGGIHAYYPSTKLQEFSNIPTDGKKATLAMLSLFYHVDDHTNKTRYICLNTGTPLVSGNPMYDYFGSVSPLRMAFDWLYDVLMSTPKDYNVVIFGHAILGQNDPTTYSSNPAKYMLHFLSGYLQRQQTSIPLTRGSSQGDLNLEKWFYGDDTTSTYRRFDFTNAPKVKKLFVVCGDGHYDAIRVFRSTSTTSITNTKYNGEVLNQSDGYLPIIMVNCDSYVRCEYWDQDDPLDRTQGTRWPMVAETTTEHSFDVVSIVGAGIQFTRIGAGDDRFIKIL